jgi:hypothetical protein
MVNRIRTYGLGTGPTSREVAQRAQEQAAFAVEQVRDLRRHFAAMQKQLVALRSEIIHRLMPAPPGRPKRW